MSFSANGLLAYPPAWAGSVPVQVSALTYCTTMTTCPSGRSVTVYRWSDHPTEDGDGTHPAAGLLRETGRQVPGQVLRVGEKSPCERRSEGVAAVLRARPRSCPGNEEPGHSLIPHASASSSRGKVRPSPESDRMRRSASAIPGLTPQAPVLGPECVQLCSRDRNHVFGACGHVNSSPARRLFIPEFTRHTPADPAERTIGRRCPARAAGAGQRGRLSSPRRQSTRPADPCRLMIAGTQVGRVELHVGAVAEVDAGDFRAWVQGGIAPPPWQLPGTRRLPDRNVPPG